MVETVEYQGIQYLKISDSNKLLLLVGDSGSGKSIFTNWYASQKKHYKKYKVLYLTEKPQSVMENAFCGMERSSKYEYLLNKHGMNTEDIIKKEDIELYVPFTFNFEQYKIPDCINLFTLPLLEVNDNSFSALLGRGLDSPTTILCQEVKIELQGSDDIYSFLYKSFLKSSLSEEGEINITYKLSKTNFFLPIESYGSKRDIEQIKYAVRAIETNYFLQDDSCNLNLTEHKLIEMINNNKCTTLFSMWKVSDERLKYFIYIELLYKINKIIIEGKIKVPLLIVFEEIKILLPKSTEVKYIKTLIEIIKKMFAGIRSSNISILATTQSYYETNTDFRDSVNEIIMMKVNSEDQKSISRDYGISSANMNLLNSLKIGQCVLFKDIKNKDGVANKFQLFYVPFAHREEGDSHFWTAWKHKYPEKMQDIKAILKSMREKQQLHLKEHEEKMKKWVDIEIQRQRDKHKKVDDGDEDTKLTKQDISLPIISELVVKIDKRTRKFRKKREMEYKSIDVKEVPEIISEIHKYKEELTSKKITTISKEQEAYELALSTPEAGNNWESRTFIMEGFTANELKKMAISYAKNIKDTEFIKKYTING